MRDSSQQNIKIEDLSLSLMSAREAAMLVGYTPDYVGRLAREKKVHAVQKGRQWFVDPESLKLFSLEAEAEKRQRQEFLRAQRIRERYEKLAISRVDAVMVSVNQSAPIALVQGLIVFLCGVLFFSVGLISYQEDLNLKAFSLGAFSVGGSLKESILWWNDSPPVTDEEFVVQKQEAASDVLSASGLVVFDGEVSPEQVDAVRESFSDQVEIDFDGSDTGIVTPVFRSGKGESYRFLMVPTRVVKSDSKP